MNILHCSLGHPPASAPEVCDRVMWAGEALLTQCYVWMLVSSPNPCNPGRATLSSLEEVGLARSANGVPGFLSPQLRASLQPWRFKSCNSGSQHGQQHRQPSPQGQRVQPTPQPGAHSELTVCVGPSSSLAQWQTAAKEVTLSVPVLRQTASLSRAFSPSQLPEFQSLLGTESGS